MLLVIFCFVLIKTTSVISSVSQLSLKRKKETCSFVVSVVLEQSGSSSSLFGRERTLVGSGNLQPCLHWVVVLLFCCFCFFLSGPTPRPPSSVIIPPWLVRGATAGWSDSSQYHRVGREGVSEFSNFKYSQLKPLRRKSHDSVTDPKITDTKSSRRHNITKHEHHFTSIIIYFSVHTVSRSDWHSKWHKNTEAKAPQSFLCFGNI